MKALLDAGVVNPSLRLPPTFFLILYMPDLFPFHPAHPLFLSLSRRTSFFLFSTSPSFANELFTTRSRAQVREVLGSILGSAGGSSYHDGHLATGTSLTISHHTSLHHGCILIFSHTLSYPRTIPWTPMGIFLAMSGNVYLTVIAKGISLYRDK